MPPSSTVFARSKAQEKNYSSVASIGCYSGTYEECSLRKWFASHVPCYAVC